MSTDDRDETIKRLRREVTHMRKAAEERNRQLDALGIVWCSGGCLGGMLRHHPDREVTAQMVEHDRAADALGPLEEARELAADLYAILADMPADPREVLGEEVYARAGRVFGWAFKDGEVQT